MTVTTATALGLVWIAQKEHVFECADIGPMPPQDSRRRRNQLFTILILQGYLKVHFKLHCIYQVLRLPASTARLPAMSLQNICRKSGNYVFAEYMDTHILYACTYVSRLWLRLL